MSDSQTSTVTFIQYDIPPLKSGEYKLVARQTVNQAAPNDFTAERAFAVGGNRFQLAGDDLVSVFPPDNANGEFGGVLPHAVLKRCTLPWQREAIEDEIEAPWLAVLLFEASEMPPVQAGTAADLIPEGTTITAIGSTTTGTGRMPAGTFSCPGINPLDYGQTPDTPTSFIDVPVGLFGRIAPSAKDLPWLAHIREVDTYDSVDDSDTTKQYAVVLGNRIPADNAGACGVLVSLENMGAYLPDNDGNSSPALPAGTTTIRLITFSSWRFYPNNLDEGFQNLAETLNKDSQGILGLTTVRVEAPAVASGDVDQAVANEPAGLGAADADVIVQNALAGGYVPLDHHMRAAGDTVSWYRGPLLPYGGTPSYLSVPAFGPDALLRYDPYTGMFDTSYAGAWQLGQLLALQSSAYATALYQWKKSLAKGAAAQAEQALIESLLGYGAAFPSFTAQRAQRTDAALPIMPEVVADFLGQLRLLVGVPFAWLVPDERMLPTESFRLFALDPNWIEALIDGAYSIGRATENELAADAEQQATMQTASAISARAWRSNDRAELAQAKSDAEGTLDTVTGVLLRSQLVPGWPRLGISGYLDSAGTQEAPKLRMAQLSNDVMLCLFDGAVAMVAIHEAPEQLHCGVELADGAASTTLRAVTGSNPGQQFLTDPKGGPASADVPLRADGQTLRVADTAQSVLDKLNTDFAQDINSFTSAEFALEFIKGVVKVEFMVGD